MSLDPSHALEQRLRAVVESCHSGLLMIDADGKIVLLNREVERLFGYAREELLGMSVDVLVPERYRGPHGGFRQGFLADSKVRSMVAGRELFGLRKDGQEVPVELGLTPVATEEGQFVLGSIVDISARMLAEQERHQLEEQLRQAHKLEAVGTLAGGIAHDFNNLLGAIVGYGELIADSVQDEQTQHDIRELLKAADRGRQLVDHILAFSRRQGIVRRPVALGQVVEEVTKLLRATLPASVEIRLRVHPELPRVLADVTSVHQILMNLGTNAPHAMPSGGTISIQLEPFYVRDSLAGGRSDLHEGPYTLMMVSDTGQGMDRVTKSRVFEPFFTTKATGIGTGLGLAVVHGIMRDHDGAVDLESEPGQGTTVRCLFPSLTTEADERPEHSRIAPRGKGERILFVEDEPALAQVGARRLVRLGYQVAIETDSMRALEMVRARPDDFDLLITDYSMPRLNGVQLGQALREVAPELAIILITGNLEGISAAEFASAGVGLVLRKPVTVQELGEGVQTLLAARVAVG